MKSKMISTIMFITGAALGSLVTWKYVKTKYERIAQEEIDSVKDAFSNHKCDSKKDKLESTEDREIVGETDGTLRTYKDITNRYSSATGGADTKNEEKGGGMSVNIEKPYIISPDDFGEIDGYETATLTYYADGVLEDDYYIVIEESEVDKMVGIDSFNHFGDHEQDTVFVRNDKLRTDFEIQRDLRKYSEIYHDSLQNGS